MNNNYDFQQWMNESEIVDVTEIFKGYTKLNTENVFGIFFLFKKGLKIEDKVQLKDNQEYDLQDVIQIRYEKRGKSLATFYYTLS